MRATNDSDLLVPDDIENDRRCLAALSALSAVRDSDKAPLEERHLAGVAHLRALTDVSRTGRRHARGTPTA